jgi:hypothetical protein
MVDSASARPKPVEHPVISQVDMNLADRLDVHCGVVNLGSGRPYRSIISICSSVWCPPDAGVSFVQPRKLRFGEHDVVGGYVLLEPNDPSGSRNRRDVSAFRKQPGDRDLRRRRADVVGYRLDFVGDREIAFEIVAGEARAGGPEVIGIELVGRADGAGQEALAER